MYIKILIRLISKDLNLLVNSASQINRFIFKVPKQTETGIFEELNERSSKIVPDNSQHFGNLSCSHNYSLNGDSCICYFVYSVIIVIIMLSSYIAGDILNT